MTETALARVPDQQAELPAPRPPAPIDSLDLKTMTSIASEVMEYVRKADQTIKIRGKDYMLIGGLQTMGLLTGVVCETESVREIRDPETSQITGFEAVACVTRLATGERVGRAIGRCDLDERLSGQLRWREKHQASSMAQTRAQSRAYASILRPIMTLAGVASTPAEEMDGTEGNDSPPRDDRPKLVSGAQVTRLWARAKDLAKNQGDAESCVRFVIERHGLQSTREIPAHLYDQVMAELEEAFKTDPPF